MNRHIRMTGFDGHAPTLSEYMTLENNDDDLDEFSCSIMVEEAVFCKNRWQGCWCRSCACYRGRSSPPCCRNRRTQLNGKIVNWRRRRHALWWCSVTETAGGVWRHVGTIWHQTTTQRWCGRGSQLRLPMSVMMSSTLSSTVDCNSTTFRPWRFVSVLYLTKTFVVERCTIAIYCAMWNAQHHH